jgi:benzodiazapine receptor
MEDGVLLHSGLAARRRIRRPVRTERLVFAVTEARLNPPNWVFGPVWTLLYIGIAAAGWLVWRETRRVQPALQLCGLQLIANGVWSWLFFGLHQPGTALVDIAVLFCLIVRIIIVSRRYSVAASWLFVPYAIWVGFAAALNASIWSAN